MTRGFKRSELRGDVDGAEAIYAEMQARVKTDDFPRVALAIAADDLGRIDDAIAYAIESVQRCDFTVLLWTVHTWCRRMAFD